MCCTGFLLRGREITLDKIYARGGFQHAVTAPTAPVKPTLPVMPSVSPATSGNDGAPADGAAVVQPPNPDFVNAVKQVEAISAALQGQKKSDTAAAAADKSAAPANAATAPATNDAKTTPGTTKQSVAPAAAIAGNDEGSAAQQTSTTAATAANPASKSTSISYLPFVGIVVIVAVILTAMKLLKHEKKRMPHKTLQQGTDNRKTSLDVEALADEKIKQKKSHFEVRI